MRKFQMEALPRYDIIESDQVQTDPETVIDTPQEQIRPLVEEPIEPIEDTDSTVEDDQEYLPHVQYSADMFKAYTAEANELVQLCYQLQHAGTEGLGDIFMRLLTGIGNLINKLFRTWKMVYRSFQGLKRTEWDDYSEKYVATLFRLKRASFMEISSIEVPFPKGLKTTYVEVTEKITTCLQACDMRKRAKSFATVSENIYKKLDKGMSTDSTVTVLFEQAGEVAQIIGLFEIYDMCFDKSSGNTAAFSKLYKSMEEFNLECSLLSEHKQYLYDVHAVHSSLMDCDNYMQKAIRIASRSKFDQTTPISKEELTSLSNACLFIAKTFDIFGVTIQDFHRVEHNHVEVCKELIRKLKY